MRRAPAAVRARLTAPAHLMNGERERWSLLTLRSGCCRGRHRRDIARCCRLSHKPAKAERETHPRAPSLSSFCVWQQIRTRLRFQEPQCSVCAGTKGHKLQRTVLSSGAPSGWQQRRCLLGCSDGEGAKVGHVAAGGGRRRAPTLEETAEWRLIFFFFFLNMRRIGVT